MEIKFKETFEQFKDWKENKVGDKNYKSKMKDFYICALFYNILIK